jgi:hypothetical protein
VGVGSIARDIVFLLMAVHLFFVPSIFSIDSWRSRHYEELYEEEGSEDNPDEGEEQE